MTILTCTIDVCLAAHVHLTDAESDDKNVKALLCLEKSEGMSAARLSYQDLNCLAIIIKVFQLTLINATPLHEPKPSYLPLFISFLLLVRLMVMLLLLLLQAIRIKRSIMVWCKSQLLR